MDIYKIQIGENEDFIPAESYIQALKSHSKQTGKVLEDYDDISLVSKEVIGKIMKFWGH